MRTGRAARTGHRKAAAPGGAVQGCPFPPVHLHTLHFRPQREMCLMRNSFVRELVCAKEIQPQDSRSRDGALG